MYQRAVVLTLMLLLPQLAAAESIVAFDSGVVTWEAVGEITVSGSPFSPIFPTIPVGTPFTMRVTFNPAATTPTFNALSPDCVTADFSGSLTLGATTYGPANGLAFTHAQLPGSTCVPDSLELTQFTFLGSLAAPDGTRFSSVYGTSIIFASYRDLFVRDAFPEIPFGSGFLAINRPDTGGSASGSFAWRVVDAEASPVPEPGTLTLFALGAAAVARRVRAQRVRH